VVVVLGVGPAPTTTRRTRGELAFAPTDDAWSTETARNKQKHTHREKTTEKKKKASQPGTTTTTRRDHRRRRRRPTDDARCPGCR